MKDLYKKNSYLKAFSQIEDINFSEDAFTDDSGAVLIKYNSGNVFCLEVSKGDFDEFSVALGGRESGGKYYIENTVGYIGKYQMGELALADVGLYIPNPNATKSNSWTGTWTKKAKKMGIKSKEDFKKNPEVQEFANKEYKIKQWKAILKMGLDKYIGQTIRGCYITASGLLAGAHLKGAKGLKRFLEGDPTFKTTDGYGTDIRSYIKRFSGYNVSDVTGISYFNIA